MRTIKAISGLLLSLVCLQSQAQTAMCFNPTTTITTGTAPFDVCSADFNNDSKADLASANLQSGNISVLLRNTTGFASAVHYVTPNGGGAHGIQAADFNHDNNMDIVVALINGPMAYYKGKGDGTFYAGVQYAAASTATSVRSADFDKDGNLDVVVANVNNASISVFNGNGDGTFDAATTYPLSSGPIVAVPMDIENDGDLDIIAGLYGTGNIGVYLNNGNGVFTASGAITSGGTVEYLTADDFNKDGKTDIATCSANSNSISVLLNSGSATFASPINISAGAPATCRGIHSADLNGDTYPELMTANAAGDNVTVFSNNGAGVFSNYNRYPSGDESFGLIAFDYNQLGKVDLAVAHMSGTSINIIENLSAIIYPQSSTTFCNGGSVVLNANPGAGSYSWSNGILTSETTITQGGTYTLTVSNAGNTCTSVSQGLTVTVNTLPTVTFAPLTAVCSTDPPFTLTGGSPTGGTYNGAAVLSGQFNPAAGSQLLFYQYTDGNNCSNTASQMQVVNTCASVFDAQENAKLVYPSPSTSEFSIHLDGIVDEVILIDSKGIEEIHYGTDIHTNLRGLLMVIVRSGDNYHKQRIVVK